MDWLILADALLSANVKSFTARRTLQRLERNEITPVEAANILREFGASVTKQSGKRGADPTK
jgi:hypothetical protein